MPRENTASAERLFVYGSLLDAAERCSLLGRAVAIRPARLPGFERGRRRHYYVLRREGSTVDGGIIEGLDQRDLAILDRYEEVPSLYTRERITIDGLECWIYLPTAWIGD